MTAPAFTPGPWSIDGQTRRNGCYVMIDGPMWGAFAEVCVKMTHEGDDSPKGWANAHLIAAAPELYEALDLFVREYVDLVKSGDAGFWDPETEIKVKDARAALAKARGEKA